jgi:hypothetical protein
MVFFCNFQDCIIITASCALQLSVVPGSDEADLIKRWGVVLKVVAGLDGSGHHPGYSTESTLDSQVDASHIIVAGFALLEIRVKDLDKTVVFKDSHPCCSDAERLFILLTGKEDKESSRILNELIDTQAREMQSEHTDISCGECNRVRDRCKEGCTYPCASRQCTQADAIGSYANGMKGVTCD